MLRLRCLAGALAAAVLVGGPTVLAFFDGGFFDQPRLAAGVVAWVLVLLAALAGEPPLPRRLPGLLSIAGLVLLTAWAAVSLTWAPLGSPAIADVQRLGLYCGTLIAAAAWLRERRLAATVEPGLALGTVVVVGFGMSERFLPALIDLERSALAFGRLEQPITYWNGTGLVAAMGLVLCARLAGDPARAPALRTAAAATVPLLGSGLYLTLSRGAMVACGAGLLLLVVLAPERAQVRSVVLTAVGAGSAALLAGLLSGLGEVGPGRGSSSSGAILLAATLALAGAAAFAQGRLAAEPAEAAARPGRRAPRWRLATGLIAVALLGAAALAVSSSGGRLDERPTGAERLRSLESPRYRYWEVAIEAAAAHPLDGLGSAGFRAEWALKGERGSFAREAHSLYLETAAELGLVGLAALALLLAGVAISTRRALARDRGASIGSAAVLATWALHAGIDWDWELPAVTLPALVCAGLLVASSERAGVPTPGEARGSADGPRA